MMAVALTLSMGSIGCGDKKEPTKAGATKAGETKPGETKAGETKTEDKPKAP
jgi:hypothetical protein